MKDDQNHHQTKSGAPKENSDKGTVADETCRWYYEVERGMFLPILVPPEWDEQKDIQGYIDLEGESDDYLQATRELLVFDVGRVHHILESGIKFFLDRRGSRHLAPLSGLSLRQKIGLFTELLPATTDASYTLRFTVNLARILWLDSERERILTQRSDQRWLYPLYRVADCLLDAAAELEESLSCEHQDFKRPPYVADEEESAALTNGENFRQRLTRLAP